MENKRFVAYEYKDITVKRDAVTLYEDCLAHFGWVLVGEGDHGWEQLGRNIASVATTVAGQDDSMTTTLKFKRDRDIKNKTEVNRLERQCVAALANIGKTERSSNAYTMGISLGTGIVGTVLLGFAHYGYRNANTALCVTMAILGIIGWGIGFFANMKVGKKKATQTEPMIQEQMDIAYEACEKAHALLA